MSAPPTTGNDPFQSFWRKRAPGVVLAVGPGIASSNPNDECGDVVFSFIDKCDRHTKSCELIGDGYSPIRGDQIVETMAAQPEGSILVTYIHGKIQNNQHALLMGLDRSPTPMERLLTRITEESGGKKFDYAFLSCRAGVNHKLADRVLPEGSLCVTLAENRKLTSMTNADQFLMTIDSPLMRMGVSLDRMLLMYLLDRPLDIPVISLTGTGSLSLPKAVAAHMGKPFTAEENERIKSRFFELNVYEFDIVDAAKEQIEQSYIDETSTTAHHSVILAAMGDPAKAMRPLAARRPE